jgi:hypothetical protein
MNIYLIPYTWARHAAVSLVVAGAAVVAWWAVLAWIVVVGPVLWRWGFLWPQGFEGAFYLCAVSTAIAFTSLYAEGSLRRRALHWRWLFASISGFIAFLCTLTGYLVVVYGTSLFVTERMAPVVDDSSLVTLRYRIAAWVLAGLSSGAGPWLTRLLQVILSNRWDLGIDVGWRKQPIGALRFLGDMVYHLGGGTVGGLLGAATWHSIGFYQQIFPGDLYLAAVAGPSVWGLMHGLLCWGIPDDLYAGWVRVLSFERYGVRIPLDSSLGTIERFVGHFPRGLDLYLPVEQGVAELHTSFLAHDHQRYSVRGLSIQPTIVRRFLEKIDLRYDQRRPAPFETDLRMEDRIRLGDQGQTQVEFLLLPREEQ